MFKYQKIISGLLSVILTVSLITPVFAVTNENYDEITKINSITTLETDEKNMPELQQEEKNMYHADKEIETLSLPSREMWCTDTKSILEKTYSQKVSTVSETEDFIIFEFNADSMNNIYNENVLMVKYIKPESYLAAEKYDTKITYTWGWKATLLNEMTKEGKWSKLKDMLIAVAGTSDVPIISFLTFIYGASLATIGSDQKVKVDSLFKAYYLNETCHVKEKLLGIWLPYVSVGCRKDIKAGGYTVYDSAGQPNPYLPQQAREGKPTENPINQDRTIKSKHFDDFRWMVKKAVELYEMDGIAHNEVIGYPDNGHITDSKP